MAVRNELNKLMIISVLCGSAWERAGESLFLGGALAAGLI